MYVSSALALANLSKGKPGSGKTVLAASTIDEIREHSLHKEPDQRANVCYFFFKSGNGTMDSTDAAFRAILTQLLESHRSDKRLIDRISFAMCETSSGQLTATYADIRELLEMCLQVLAEVFVILDGLDECKDNTVTVRELLQLSETSSVKIILFSRSNVRSLARSVMRHQQIPLNHAKVTEDIRVYLSRKVALLREERLIPSSSRPAELCEHLCRGADGMFLWAKLMSIHLRSPALTPLQRLETVINVTLPEGLTAMYDRILRLIESSGAAQRDLASRILMWLTCAIKPLSCNQLHDAVRVGVNHGLENVEGSGFTDFQHSVIMTCEGLVEPDEWEPSDKPTMALIHLSAKQYLAGIAAQASMPNIECGHLASSTLVTSPMASHLNLARKCLQYLTFNIPAQPFQTLSSWPGLDELLNHSFPLAAYASKRWMDHLCETNIWTYTSLSLVPKASREPLYGLIKSLSLFIRKSLVLQAWIQAYYVEASLGSLERRLGNLAQWAKSASKLFETGSGLDGDMRTILVEV